MCVRHVDSAQAYRNEAQVGQAVQESGLRREDLFISTSSISYFMRSRLTCF